jgi:hypothetical protein
VQINSLQSSWSPQASPSVGPLRGISTQPFIPTAPKVAPVEFAPAGPVDPQSALKSWLNQYSSSQNGLFDRVVADSSAEATMFRRGLMISGVVTLAGNFAE